MKRKSAEDRSSSNLTIGSDMMLLISGRFEVMFSDEEMQFEGIC